MIIQLPVRCSTLKKIRGALETIADVELALVYLTGLAYTIVMRETLTVVGFAAFLVSLFGSIVVVVCVGEWICEHFPTFTCIKDGD